MQNNNKRRRHTYIYCRLPPSARPPARKPTSKQSHWFTRSPGYDILVLVPLSVCFCVANLCCIQPSAVATSWPCVRIVVKERDVNSFIFFCCSHVNPYIHTSIFFLLLNFINNNKPCVLFIIIKPQRILHIKSTEARQPRQESWTVGQTDRRIERRLWEKTDAAWKQAR